MSFRLLHSCSIYVFLFFFGLCVTFIPYLFCFSVRLPLFYNLDRSFIYLFINSLAYVTERLAPDSLGYANAGMKWYSERLRLSHAVNELQQK